MVQPAQNVSDAVERLNSNWNLWMPWTQRYLWLRVAGPGRVAIQSAFEPVGDNGRNITSHSPATRQNW